MDLSEDFGGKDVYAHLTTLTYNDEGRKNLYLLFNKSFDKISKPRWGHKKPMNTWQQLIDHKEGLFVGTGCCIGPAAKALLKGRPDLALKYLDKLIDIFGKDNIFAEFMPTEAKFNWNRKTGEFEPNPCTPFAPNGCIVEGYQKWLLDEGVIKRKMRPCLTTDSHYVKKEEKEIQDLILMSAEGGWKFSQVLDIPKKEEMFEKLKYLDGFCESAYDEMVSNAEFYCERVKYEKRLK